MQCNPEKLVALACFIHEHGNQSAMSTTPQPLNGNKTKLCLLRNDMPD